MFTRGPADRLAYPPGGIRPKMAAALIIKFFCRAHQTKIALLNEINERNASASIAARDGDNKPKIGFYKFAASQFIACRGALCQVYLFCMSE